MIVFSYDKTFEGLLTSVFDAYSRKTYPERLIEVGSIEPMFTDEVYTVITEIEKSTRVWSALEKKLSKISCRLLTYVWLSEIEGSDELIFRYICKVFNNNLSIETNFADEDVLQVKQVAEKVSKERHHLMQFVRFQKAADDMYFAPVSPLYNALPISLNYFKDRFADQKWVIYDLKRNYGFYYDLQTTVEVTFEDQEHILSGMLDANLMAEDEKMFQELWKGYFKAMTIKERINLKLQKQHMPKRFWKYLTEKQ